MSAVYAKSRVDNRYFRGWYRTHKGRQWPACPRCGVSMPHAAWDRETYDGRMRWAFDVCVTCLIDITPDAEPVIACPTCRGHGNVWTGEPFRYEECPTCHRSGVAA